MSLIRTMSKIYSHQKEMNLEGNWAFHISIGNKSLWKFHKQNDYLIGILFFVFFDENPFFLLMKQNLHYSVDKFT